MLAFGIAITIGCVIAVAIAAWMFIWAAKKDGDDQKRRDALHPRR